MAKSKKVKKHKPISWVVKIKKEWSDRSPVVRFVVLFALGMLLFYLFWGSAWFQSNITPLIATVYAHISNVFLKILGYGTIALGDSISNDDFSISIANGCDAIEAMAIFVVGVMTFPQLLKLKMKGVFWGVSLLFLLNIIRIVSLFIIGSHASTSVFEFMHIEFWQTVFLFLAIIAWVFWLRWSIQQNKLQFN